MRILILLCIIEFKFNLVSMFIANYQSSYLNIFTESPKLLTSCDTFSAIRNIGLFLGNCEDKANDFGLKLDIYNCVF